MRTLRAVAVVAVLFVALTGCTKTGGGQPVAATATATTTGTTPASPTTNPAPVGIPTSSTEFELPPFGVLPTTRKSLAPNADTCPADHAGSVTFAAKVADPEAPSVVVDVPPQFLPSSGAGDVAATMTGPDGMSATVTIVSTDLDAAAAFKQYGDTLTAASPISSISVLPGDLCGYSGQS
jgi:hypothetical protein